MPGMSGRELAERLKSLYPEMKVIYMSGYTDDTLVHHGLLMEEVNHVQNPFSMEALAKRFLQLWEKMRQKELIPRVVLQINSWYHSSYRYTSFQSQLFNLWITLIIALFR